MSEQFISETITPVPGTADTARMAAGEPGLPRAFVWHGETLEIAGVLRTWRETGPCHHGSDERYVRKHWYEVMTVGGQRLTIYFERQARRGSHPRREWRLFSIAEPA